MTEAILSHGATGLFSVFARTVQQIRNRWYDAENDGNFLKISAALWSKKKWIK